MGSSLLEESELDSKSLVSMNSPSSLVESLHLPDPESIIGVKEGGKMFLSNLKEALYEMKSKMRIDGLVFLMYNVI